MPQGSKQSSTELDLPMKQLDDLMKELITDSEMNTATQSDIIKTILEAETIDDVLSGDVIHVEDLNYDNKGFSEVIEIVGNLRIQPSSFRGTGLTFYSVTDARIDGDLVTFVTSSANICAQLIKILHLQAFPQPVHVRMSHSRPREDAPEGFDVYRLVKVRKKRNGS